jgi:hypothetical protein
MVNLFIFSPSPELSKLERLAIYTKRRTWFEVTAQFKTSFLLFCLEQPLYLYLPNLPIAWPRPSEDSLLWQRFEISHTYTGMKYLFVLGNWVHLLLYGSYPCILN